MFLQKINLPGTQDVRTSQTTVLKCYCMRVLFYNLSVSCAASLWISVAWNMFVFYFEANQPFKIHPFPMKTRTFSLQEDRKTGTITGLQMFPKMCRSGGNKRCRFRAPQRGTHAGLGGANTHLPSVFGK